MRSRDLIKSLDGVYNEIDEQNNNHWSKVTFIIVSFMSAILNLLIFISLFTEIHILFRILFMSSAVIIGFISITYLLFPAIIANETFNAYKYLNNLYIAYNRWSLPFSLNLKVIHFPNGYQK